MRKFSILLMILGLALICAPTAQAVETLGFSSSAAASFDFFGGGNSTGAGSTVGFTQGTADNPAGSGTIPSDFTITLVNGGSGPAIGDNATITPSGSNWTVGTIGTESGGTVETATLSGTATLTIEDHSGVDLTGTLSLVKIETNTAGTVGSLNDQLVVNLTGVTYSGTDPDLQALLTGLDVLEISLTSLTSGDDLTTLASGTGEDLSSSYAGGITVPLPTTALLLGSGLLGLALLGFRRKGTALEL